LKTTLFTFRFRILIVIGLGLVLLLVLILSDMQLSDEARAAAAQQINTVQTTTYISTVSATRGEILDRYGRALISNEQIYSIRFNKSTWSSSEQNDILLSLYNLVRQKGYTYTDSLPISNSPYSYTVSAGSSLSIRTSFDSFMEKNDWKSSASASEVMELLADRYHIAETYTNTQRRIIIGLRYDMEKAEFSVYNPFTFLSDIDIELISAIKDRSYAYPGVEIITESRRIYKTDVAAHILGRVGKIFKEEYEELAAQGYSMNAIVGKDGVEKAFEGYLKGTDGYLKTSLDSYGNTIEVLSKTDPQPGYNVILTIDETIQRKTEAALANRIQELKTLSAEDPKKYPEDVGGGAAVMMKVNSGEVLALANYPTYNLATFSEDYNDLLENELTPMLNRAISGTYPIGSVFKMVTAIAALEEGYIQPRTLIEDLGKYTKYRGFQPQCWIYRQNYGATHGIINVSEAIRDSCNYFFYSVADEMGIDIIDKWAAAFGLGVKTGIEIAGEATGQRANAASKIKSQGKNAVWGPGDTLTAAIGQSYSLFTPIQVCAYLSAVCNGGYYYQPHLLKEVTTYDYSSVVMAVQPTLVNTIQMSQSTYHAVMQGMKDCAENGTAAKVFENYPIAVGGKTGSSQVSSGTSNGVFAAFAPFNNPEVAVFIIVEHGGSGGNVGTIARDMFDAYFGVDSGTQKSVASNSIG